MFQVHDKVVYPAHGVAEIEEVTEKLVGGSAVAFVKLVFLFKDMTILVPVYNLTNIGVRKPSSPEAISKVMAELYNKPDRKFEVLDFTPSGWNKRNKDYQIKIQSGDLFKIAGIYRDLMHVAQQKDLSFGERGLLQVTEELLAQEIQVARNVERELVVQELRAPFRQLAFRSESFLDDGATASSSSVSEASSGA